MGIFKTKEERLKSKAMKQLEKDRAQVRKPDEIQKDYMRLCNEAGDKQYRIKVLTTELEQINQSLFRLNQEFHRASQVHAKSEEEKKALTEPVKQAMEAASKGPANETSPLQ